MLLVLHAARAADPCAGVADCQVIATRELVVPTGKPPARVIELAYAAPEEIAKGVDGPRYGEDCVKRLWMLETTAGLRPILEVCNDGYGASGVGEDDITIEGTRFTHRQSGGSAWRWSHSASVELLTPALTAWSDDQSFMVQHDLGRSWSFEKGTGSFSQSFLRCDAPDAGDAQEPSTMSGPVLPWLPAVAGFDWRTMPLGTCSQTVDSATGPLAHGTAGAAADATMKAVLLGQTLLVEVTDDTWVEQAKSWVKADHLEIWWTAAPRMDNACFPPSKPLQWGVMLDGRVEAALGSPPPLKVETLAFDGGRRWRIEGFDTESMTGLTVVYSDSDDGKRQERLIGTTAVVFGDPQSLGLPFKPPQSACVVTPAGLELRYTPTFPADKPLLDSFGSLY